MGFSYVKIFRLIVLSICLFPVAVFSADSNSGVAATLTDFVMPHYKNNVLQFVLYGEKGENLGSMITLTDPLIDIVLKDLPDVELVTLMKGVKSPSAKSLPDEKRLYPLGTSWNEILKFWIRLPHSQALISAEKAKYDKNLRLLSGDGPVYLRAREIDIDGVGFDANQKKKFVHIRSKVKVVFRPHANEFNKHSSDLLRKTWEKKGDKTTGDVLQETIRELGNFSDNMKKNDQKKLNHKIKNEKGER